MTEKGNQTVEKVEWQKGGQEARVLFEEEKIAFSELLRTI